METNTLIPIRVAPQARTQRRGTSAGNELRLKCNKSLKEMKTLERLADRINRGILKMQVSEVMVNEINTESRTNKKKRKEKFEGWS